MTRRLRHPAVLGLLAVAEFMLTLDLSIVNVGLPAIRADLGFDQGSLQWVVNGYGLTFAGFLLLGGRAADLFGGRRVFLSALGVFTLSSLACGLADAQGTLVAARIVQGLSAGVLSPATLSMLTSTYRAPDERNRALSLWTGVAIGGGAIGALLGGLLVGAISWRAIFFVNVPVGAALLGLAALRLPRDRAAPTGSRLDVAGAVAVTAGLTALVWALTRSPDGWASPEVVGGLVAAAVLLAAFTLIETSIAPAPLVPFAVFRSRALTAGNVLSLLSFVPVMATWFFLTLELQGVRGYTPLQTGLLFLPLTLGVVAGSQLSFKLVGHTDARALFGAGGVVAAAGLAAVSALAADAPVGWVIAAASVSMGGGGLMFAPITVAATSGLPPEQGGLASGLLNTTRQIGGALGLAMLSTIAAGEGFGTAFALGAAASVVTALVGAILLPRALGEPIAVSARRHSGTIERWLSRRRGRPPLRAGTSSTSSSGCSPRSTPTGRGRPPTLSTTGSARRSAS
ncbi:MAG TPA: MFS transporter [Solirubrobacteraceae bacterium]|nr:MFS transporter [Solirubrobacteraceae bacterium]